MEGTLPNPSPFNALLRNVMPMRSVLGFPMVDWHLVGQESRRVLRSRHVSLQTGQSYVGWSCRFRNLTGERPCVKSPQEAIVA